MNEAAERIFRKSIRLLQQKGGTKIRQALLLVQSDIGVFYFELNPKELTPENALLSQQYVADYIKELHIRRMGSNRIQVCSDCLGQGEKFNNDILETCGRCKGGGQIVMLQIGENNET